MELTKEILSERLDAICMQEFKDNYNKSEYARIFYNNQLAKDLQNELNANVKEGFRFHISSTGTLTIEQFIEKGEGYETWRNVKTILAPLTYKLPYAYVMGKPVGKKVMEQIVKEAM